MPALYLNTGRAAGEQLSSTYEGRYLSLEESYLIHPYHAADTLVDGGDPVLFAVGSSYMNGVGVAMSSAAAATDIISIDTEGIWFLSVLGAISDGSPDGAAKALAAGDPVYICKDAGQVNQLSGQDDPDHWVPFGYLLGDVAASTTGATVVAVKVHWDQDCLSSINLGSIDLVNQVLTSDNFNIDTSAAARARGEAGETWGIEYAWLKAYLGLSDPLAADEDVYGIYVRLEDKQHSAGGDLFAARFQTHANHAAAVWTRLYGAMVVISNEASGTITESIGLSVSMGGAGCAPAMQTVFQVMGDGTLSAARQSWFQTEIARGAGLKAEATNVTTKVYEIPIDINGTIYAIPVIPWI